MKVHDMDVVPDDRDLLPYYRAIDDTTPAIQIFRVWDDITLMRDDTPIVSYRLLMQIKEKLEAAMKRENITYKELDNRALWRDQDF